MKLAITLATRGRASQLIDTIKRSVRNWTEPNTCLYVIADEDDHPTIEALQKNPIDLPGSARTEPPLYLVVRPRPDTVAEKWNAVTELCPDADAYLISADDAPDITPGYDTKILNAASRFDDGIGVVYGHLANASFPAVMAPTRKFVEKLGFLFPPYFPYWFVDHWIDDIARLIDRISFADVTTDQCKVGPTLEFREPAWWATWFDAAYLVRRRQAYRIIADDEFKETEGRKQMLYAHCPLIEYRSRWINNNVRASHAYVGPPPDERYQRIKKQAVDMVPQLLLGMPEFPELDIRQAQPTQPGYLGAWGSRLYEYHLTPPQTIPSIARAYG